MKTSLLVSTLFFSLLQADTNMSWIDQKVEEIKPQREGLSSAAINAIKSPFIVIKEEVKVVPGSGPKIVPASIKADEPVKKDMSQEPLTLQMVFNSSALINGAWYKENAVVRGYALTQIQSGYVLLERKNKKLKLFITQKSKNLNISTK